MDAFMMAPRSTTTTTAATTTTATTTTTTWVQDGPKMARDVFILRGKTGTRGIPSRAFKFRAAMDYGASKQSAKNNEIPFPRS